MKNQKGMAPLILLAILAGALLVGFVFQKATKITDHPIEQAAEQVLASHGIDIDFSKDKKDKLKGK